MRLHARFAQSRHHPYKGWLEALGITPWFPTASQGALAFLSVQATIALDALLMPMNGRLYYFDLTLKRVFILFHTEFVLHNIVLFLVLYILLYRRFI